MRILFTVAHLILTALFAFTVRAQGQPNQGMKNVEASAKFPGIWVFLQEPFGTELPVGPGWAIIA